MPLDRAILDFDDATARLGRALYAEVRRLDVEERARIRREAPSSTKREGTDGGSLSWLSGDDGACHAGHGGDCDGGSD